MKPGFRSWSLQKCLVLSVPAVYLVDWVVDRHIDLVLTQWEGEGLAAALIRLMS